MSIRKTYTYEKYFYLCVSTTCTFQFVSIGMSFLKGLVHILTHIKFDKLQYIRINVLCITLGSTKNNSCNLYQLKQIERTC